MTRLSYDQDGKPTPSKLDSMLVWKKMRKLDWAREGLNYNENGICVMCEGSERPMEVKLKNEGWTRCVCWTVQKEQRYIKAQDFATKHDILEWKDFEIWGSQTSKSALTSALTTLKRWTLELDTWLLIAGKVGTGKSHLLHTLDTYLRPWSLYMSVPDLKDLTFAYTGKNELDVLLNKISTHPILLLDDVGAEYASSFAVSTVRQIIMARYNRWQEFPTVVSTNLTDGQLKDYDERMWDRLMDNTKVRDIPFLGVESWRQHGN
jgi:DNA replication protein DnaC